MIKFKRNRLLSAYIVQDGVRRVSEHCEFALAQSLLYRLGFFKLMKWILCSGKRCFYDSAGWTLMDKYGHTRKPKGQRAEVYGLSD